MYMVPIESFVELMEAYFNKNNYEDDKNILLKTMQTVDIYRIVIGTVSH